VVLAGAATVAEALAPGMEVRLDAGWLGSVSVRVEP
jgi:2-keto-4-pentenoate hydratase